MLGVTQWNPELCRADSDGDGRTNGEELGDPDCNWTSGTIPDRVSDITHPGRAVKYKGFEKRRNNVHKFKFYSINF